MSTQQRLESMHSHLMYNKFPYHSVSVIYRHQDLGFHIMFMGSVKDIVTDKIKGYLKANEFTYSFVPN